MRYPETERLRHELSKIKPTLPTIQGRSSRLTYAQIVDFAVGATPDETIDLLPQTTFGNNKELNNFAAWFIEMAFCLIEEKPQNIRGYYGLIGEDGQMIDYLHCDPMNLRFTATVADSSCSINPSTLICPNYALDDPSRSLLEKVKSVSASEIPKDIFLPQETEGSIVIFGRNQYHTEATLPTGAAKVFMSASF